MWAKMLGEQMDRSADSRPIACVEKLLNSDRSENHLLPSSFCSEKKKSHKGKQIEPKQTPTSVFNISAWSPCWPSGPAAGIHIVQGCLVLGLLPKARHDFTFINSLFSHSEKNRDVSHGLNVVKRSFFPLFLPPFLTSRRAHKSA